MQYSLPSSSVDLFSPCPWGGTGTVCSLVQWLAQGDPGPSTSASRCSAKDIITKGSDESTTYTSAIPSILL